MLCVRCNNIFHTKQKYIKHELKYNRGRVKYCSKKSLNEDKLKGKKISCINCNNILYKRPSEIKQSKSGNIFCSRSCAASYNNKNKSHGTRRSKLEIWLEEELTKLYPNLHMDFNGKEAIGSELDIHIPSLNLAFELNGIFHYEPIYGEDKLQKIEENDISKSKACHDAKIDLCVIDTSGQKYFKPKTSEKYLNIITNIINKRTMLNS